jgi:hypothetical protein
VDVFGETAIEHGDKVWSLNGFMELKRDEPVRFYNNYTIQPILPGRDHTAWTSVNPSLGTLVGRFMIVGDIILSRYRSEDGKYSGTESLRMVDPKTYENRGFAFQESNKLSSWQVTLERISET